MKNMTYFQAHCEVSMGILNLGLTLTGGACIPKSTSLFYVVTVDKKLTI